MVFTISYIWFPPFIIVLGILTPLKRWAFILADSALTLTVPILFDVTLQWGKPRIPRSNHKILSSLLTKATI